MASPPALDRQTQRAAAEKLLVASAGLARVVIAVDEGGERRKRTASAWFWNTRQYHGYEKISGGVNAQLKHTPSANNSAQSRLTPVNQG